MGDRALVGLIPPVGMAGSGNGGILLELAAMACDEPRDTYQRAPLAGVGASGVLGKSRSRRLAGTLPPERAMLECFDGKDRAEGEEGMTGGLDLVTLCLDGVFSINGSTGSALSRREPSLRGGLISRREGGVLDFQECSRRGDTSAAMLEVDDTGTAD